MSQIYERMKDPDITFRCCDVDILAHKVVISARSTVLRAMLKTPTLEARTGVIDVQIFDADCIQKFVKYLYTASIKIDDASEAVGMYQVADYFHIPDLKEICKKKKMMKLVNYNSASEIAILSKMHNEKKLFSVTTNFITNHAPEDFKNWDILHENFPAIPNEILEKIRQIDEELFKSFLHALKFWDTM